MQIKYKYIKTPVPCCGDCGERLSGNGSSFLPYRCSCGTWGITDWNNPNELSIIDCACMAITGKKNLAFNRHSKYECGNDDIGVMRA